ncbi:glycine betaine ABC transporter substrate-binding protein [Mycoplasmatota bacterium WC30]
MKKIQIILLLLITVMLVSCGGNKKEVNLGLLRVPNDAMLAKQMGLFEEKFNALGYEVNYFYFDSGVDANKGIASGDIDFATMGNINGLVALGSNLDAELVWIHETLGAVEALAVKDSANITTVEDLAGKTIATTFASTAHYVLLNVLKEAGIEDDVQLLNMKTPELVAAWNRGDIDAAYTWQPSLGQLLLDGTVLVSSEDMIEKGYMTANIELARKSFAEENPVLVQTYVECMVEAYDYFNSSRTDAINLLSIELELTVEEITVQVDGSIWTSLTEMQDATYNTGYIDTMYSQTFFLIDQDFLSRDITRDEVVAFINNSYSLDVENEETN